MLNSPITNMVRWNEHEKIIGVVGVAPVATADFYHKLIRLTPTQKDWEHVRVIIDSNPKIPSRGRYLELNETDPVPYIRQSIHTLQEIGASIIALPCNTAHILYDRYAENFPNIFIPNMIKATTDTTIRSCSRPVHSVAVFASRLTQQHRLYHQAFNKYSIDILDTTKHQADISNLIEQTKQGKSIAELTKKMHHILSAYKQADAFIIGCTELSLLVAAEFEGVPVIDSNVALANTCLAHARNDAFDHSIAGLSSFGG